MVISSYDSNELEESLRWKRVIQHNKSSPSNAMANVHCAIQWNDKINAQPDPKMFGIKGIIVVVVHYTHTH